MRKIFLTLILYFLTLNSAFSLIQVDITRGNLNPLPIAVSPLHVDIKSEDYQVFKVRDLGIDISKNQIFYAKKNYENK